jgi:hypothetical protein
MVAQNDRLALNVSSFFNLPESNVFASTRNQTVVVKGAESEAGNIKLASLLSSNHKFSLFTNQTDVPDDYHLFSFFVDIHTGQEPTIFAKV